MLPLEHDRDYALSSATHCCGCGEPFAHDERRIHVTLDPSTDAWACVRCAGESLLEDDTHYEEDGISWQCGRYH